MFFEDKLCQEVKEIENEKHLCLTSKSSGNSTSITVISESK